MKTSYYLVAAAGLTAAVAIYLHIPGRSGLDAVPSLPVPVDPPPPDPAAEPPLAPQLVLPIVPPPDEPLVIPAGGGLGAPASSWAPPPIPTPPAAPPVPAATPAPLPEPPALPLPVPAPSIPAPPAVPAGLPTLPVGPPVPPAVPVVPPALPVPPADVPPQPPTLATPPSPPVQPGLPVAPVPNPVQPVAPKPPVQDPNPALLPAPTPLTPAPTSPKFGADLAPAGKFAVLKGHQLVEGAVAVAGGRVTVRQGSFERSFPKADVLFVGETRDGVYRFVLSRVSATDPVARLGVARWCMFGGLRAQALAEAREVLKLQPGNTAAAEMARSLEESLKQFPEDGPAPAAKPVAGGTLTTVEPEPDVTAEGATSFALRAQPVLANLCMECHARTGYTGALKLTRVTGFEAGPQTTKANLLAVAGQLKKEDPLNSPLLAKALTVHGGLKQPAIANRNVPAYRVLEAWVVLAAGTPVQPMVPPAEPALAAPAVPSPPMRTPPVPPMPPPVTPLLPPAEPGPVAPPVEGSVPVPPPASPAVPVPPVLPTPAVLPPITPTVPPAVPPAATGPKPPAVPILPIPPAVAAPKPPGGVQPAGGSQFGTTAPKKPPATQPATAGDEFDPAGFNGAGPTGK